MRMYDQFGITPRSRGYVSAAPKPVDDEENGFVMLNRGPQTIPR
jgi:hypothetical protein